MNNNNNNQTVTNNENDDLDLSLIEDKETSEERRKLDDRRSVLFSERRDILYRRNLALRRGR